MEAQANVPGSRAKREPAVSLEREQHDARERDDAHERDDAPVREKAEGEIKLSGERVRVRFNRPENTSDNSFTVGWNGNVAQIEFDQEVDIAVEHLNVIDDGIVDLTNQDGSTRRHKRFTYEVIRRRSH